MFTNIGLTITGLIFTSFIALIYLEKKKYDSLENNIYKFLLILTLLLLVLELTCVFTMSIRDQIPLLNEILCRGYILGATIWVETILAYGMAQSSEKEFANVNELLKDKKMGFLILVGFIAFIISCFLEVKYTSGSANQFVVIGGPAVYSLYVLFIFVGTYMGGVLIKDYKKDNFIKTLPIIVFTVSYVVLGAIQLFYTDLNDLTFLFALSVIAMYFTLENQDILLASELEEAKQNAEKADKAKTEFLSKMSHEIRTPMNVILGFSETLINEKSLTEKEVKKDVKNIYNAGKNLLEIINNILIFSRIESGREKVENAEYLINDIIFELDSYVRSKIDPKKVAFKINIDENTPSNYIGDRLKVYRILLNLINNSIKYTSDGEIILNIKCIPKEENTVNLSFEVKDTGLGMKQETLDNLFQEFSKLDSSDLNISGTGLGLVLAKKLISMLEGEVTFNSEYGIGTTFNVTLEQKVVGNKKLKDIRLSNNKDINEDYFDCSKYKILVVDDNNLNRKVIEKLLKPYNIGFEAIDNGADCIQKIKAGEKYDLILLDHMMPDLDGIETVRILKKTGIKDLPPIVAMTANVVTEIKEKYIKEGFSDYLAKPVDIKDLNKLLNKYFNKEDRG